MMQPPLVENPINRYSIGDRTPGVIRDDDGALTITISHDRPTDPVAAANWLPAPDCPFRPVLRMYEPDPSVINMTYVVPAITRQSRIWSTAIAVVDHRNCHYPRTRHEEGLAGTAARHAACSTPSTGRSF